MACSRLWPQGRPQKKLLMSSFDFPNPLLFECLVGHLIIPVLRASWRLNNLAAFCPQKRSLKKKLISTTKWLHFLKFLTAPFVFCRDVPLNDWALCWRRGPIATARRPTRPEITAPSISWPRFCMRCPLKFVAKPSLFKSHYRLLVGLEILHSGSGSIMGVLGRNVIPKGTCGFAGRVVWRIRACENRLNVESIYKIKKIAKIKTLFVTPHLVDPAATRLELIWVRWIFRRHY